MQKIPTTLENLTDNFNNDFKEDKSSDFLDLEKQIIEKVKLYDSLQGTKLETIAKIEEHKNKQLISGFSLLLSVVSIEFSLLSNVFEKGSFGYSLCLVISFILLVVLVIQVAIAINQHVKNYKLISYYTVKLHCIEKIEKEQNEKKAIEKALKERGCNMKISFFEKENSIDQAAIGAGVYQFKIGLAGDKKEKFLSLYIGESYSMMSRCSNHLYNVFFNDPAYFGLKKEHIENDKLELSVEVYESVNVKGKTYSERDCLLREIELSAIEKEKPLSQSQTSDTLSKKRVEVVSAAIDKLLSHNDL